MEDKTLIYELKNLKKVYNERIALNVGKLHIHRGAIYGIIGEVGSGKSALLRQIAGLETPTEGTLLYNNDPFKTNWLGKIKPSNEIRYINSFTQNGNQNVGQYFTMKHGKESAVIQRQHFNKGFKRFMWDQPMDSLSQGEITWVYLIDALQSDPRVLIVNNWGAHLDIGLENDLKRLLKKLNRSLGTTIILSSVLSQKLQNFATVMVFMNNGHVSKIRSGRPSNNRKRPQNQSRR